MRIILDSRNTRSAVLAAQRVQSMLDKIEGEEVISTVHRALICTEYTVPNNFTANAVKYGMLIKIAGQGTQKHCVWVKTHNYPEFVLPEAQAPAFGRDYDSTRAKAATNKTKPAKKAAPKQGDGSTTKPKFNYSIASLRSIPRTERNQPSRLSLIGAIEDLGGYQQHMNQPTGGRVHTSKGRY